METYWFVEKEKTDGMFCDTKKFDSYAEAEKYFNCIEFDADDKKIIMGFSGEYDADIIGIRRKK